MLKQPPVTSVGFSFGISKMWLETLRSPKTLSATFTNTREDESTFVGYAAMLTPFVGIQALNGRKRFVAMGAGKRIRQVLRVTLKGIKLYAKILAHLLDVLVHGGNMMNRLLLRKKAVNCMTNPCGGTPVCQRQAAWSETIVGHAAPHTTMRYDKIRLPP